MKMFRPLSVVIVIGALSFAAGAMAQNAEPAPQAAHTEMQAPAEPAPPATAQPEAAAAAATSQTTQVASEEPARRCRTRKEAGEACACLSAPSEVGAVQAANDGGRNMCVVPSS